MREPWARSGFSRTGRHAVLVRYDAAAHEFIVAPQDDSDRFAIYPMLLDEDTSGQCFNRIFVKNWYRDLQHVGTCVQEFIHKLHRTAGDFDTMLESLMLCVETWQSRKQRRMDIENASGKSFDELGA